MSGQVIFGDAVTLSADAPAQHRLHRATGRKCSTSIWRSRPAAVSSRIDTARTICGAPVQWAIGLEILLRVEDPWRVFLTTDHPNGGAFTA